MEYDTMVLTPERIGSCTLYHQQEDVYYAIAKTRLTEVSTQPSLFTPPSSSR